MYKTEDRLHIAQSLIQHNKSNLIYHNSLHEELFCYGFIAKHGWEPQQFSFTDFGIKLGQQCKDTVLKYWI